MNRRVLATLSLAIAPVAGAVDPDSDGDGVHDGVDNCPTIANSDQADSNADLHGDACVHPTATFGGGTVVERGAVVGALVQVGGNTVLRAGSTVASRATIAGGDVAIPSEVGDGSTVGRRFDLGFRSAVFDDVTLSPDGTIGDDAVTEDGSSFGYGSTAGNGLHLGAGAIVGNLVGLGDDVTIEAGARVGRGTALGNRVYLFGGAEVGAACVVGDDATFGADARVRRGSTVGADSDVGDFAAIGRGVTLAPGTYVGANATIRSGADILPGGCVDVDEIVPKDAQVSTCTAALPEVCDDSVDNDLDARLDCADATCFGGASCLDGYKQRGTAGWEYGYAVAIDPSTGDAFVAANPGGALPPGSGFGGEDVWVARFSGATGAMLWSRQVGSASADVPRAIMADGSKVCVAGGTSGALFGPSAGSYDAFVACLNPTNGTIVWSRQFGGGFSDYAYGVAPGPGGDVYVAAQAQSGLFGQTHAGGEDVVVLRLSGATGTNVAVTQFGGASGETPYGIDVDAAGNLYVAGDTGGSGAYFFGASAGGRDAFIASLAPDLSLRWTRQIGTSGNEFVGGSATSPDGTSTIVGSTSGSMFGANQGGFDAFVVRYQSDATMLAPGLQLGTAGTDMGKSADANASGSVIAVETDGALLGPSLGSKDGLVVRLDAAGGTQWATHVGGSNQDAAFAAALDGENAVWVTGWTQGSLAGSNAGGADIFVGKLAPDGTVQ